ncbi:xylulokinase [Tautonia rosea]|uniref:xylulokinase n=1 Tax=Tautonia rosea TaxID=2728037 RepID=UPI00147562E9|nr:xylulokinase [Tautonia rosea]
MSVTLGIDIGTSGTKTLAVRESGEILASASAEYPCSYPKPGWSEQDPSLWWNATIATVREVLAKGHLKPEEISGIGLSGQMHGSVFLDEQGEVVRPALLWNDQRTGAECAEIEAIAGGREALVRMVANRALTGFTAPKLLWVRTHEPKQWDRVRTVLLPKDYIRYKLSGTFATEVSDASGTLLLDVANRKWSDELLAKLDLDRSLLPDCFESFEVSAQVSAKGAETTGLKPGTPIVGGGGDQPAGAVGNGIVRSGAVSATMGTSGVVFCHTDEPGFDPEGRLQRGCHAVPGAWHVMGVVLAAGGALQWFRNELGKAEVLAAKEQGVDPYFLLTDEAATVGPGAEGLFFLPYLTGERTPHFDPHARGGWIGLTVRHGRAHMIRSVMEGATYAMRDSLELIREMGAAITQIRVSGGGARNALWKQIQADIYGQDVCTINASEGPAFGVALLAMVGTGTYSSVAEACDATIQVVETTPVDPSTKGLYDMSYPIYRGLYGDLKGRFTAMDALVRGA